MNIQELRFRLNVFESMDGVAQSDQRAYVCDSLASRGLKEDYFIRRNIRSMPELQAYKRRIRSNMIKKVMGGYVPKGPVPAKKTGMIKENGYVIEQWVLQAFPKLYVPVLVYVPASTGRLPLIVNPCGHSYNGSKYAAYQHICVNLVRRGYVVATWDPPGQGERGDYFDTASGNHHGTAAGQCFFAGISFANFYHYEAMRIVDWMITRSDVDAKRIGVTGVSGGGSTSAWLMGMDDRIRAGAPCMGTVTCKALMSPIPGVAHHDEDNHVDMALPYGTNFEAFLAAFCPRPQLIMAGTEDFTFPHEDVARLYRHVKQVYRNLGAEKYISFAVAREPHGYPEVLRQKMYHFFAEHLGGDDRLGEYYVVPKKDEALHCTRSGRVREDLNSETARTLAYKYFRSHRQVYSFVGGAERIRAMQRRTRRHVSRTLRLDDLKGWSYEQRHESDLPANGYIVRRVRLFPYRERFVSGTFFLPKDDNGVPVLVVGDTSYANTADNPFIQACVANGVGLLYVGLFDCNNRQDMSSSFVYMAGRFEAAMKVEDILTACKYLRVTGAVRKDSIYVCGCGRDAIYPLYAAALDPGIAGCAVNEVIVSLESILAVDSFFQGKGYAYDWVLERTKGAALCADVDDLMAAIAPRRCLVTNPWEGRLMDCDAAGARWRNARRAYSGLKAPANLECRNVDQRQVSTEIVRWVLGH